MPSCKLEFLFPFKTKRNLVLQTQVFEISKLELFILFENEILYETCSNHINLRTEFIKKIIVWYIEKL